MFTFPKNVDLQKGQSSQWPALQLFLAIEQLASALVQGYLIKLNKKRFVQTGENRF